MRYEYWCDDCDDKRIIEASIYAAPGVNVMCAECGAAMWRIWTPIPVHFKGDGWAGKK